MLTRSASVLRGLLRPALGQGPSSRHLVRAFCSPVKDTFQRLGIPYQEELLQDYVEIVSEIKRAQEAYRLSPDGEAKAEYIKLLTVLGYEVEAHKVLAESGWSYGLGPYNPQFLTRSLGEFFISRRRKGSYSALEIMFWLILLFSVNWESIIQMFGVEKLSLSLLGGIIEVEPVPKKDQGVKFKDIIVVTCDLGNRRVSVRSGRTCRFLEETFCLQRSWCKDAQGCPLLRETRCRED